MRSMGKSVVIDETEIDRRKPVWVALSELWPDNELEDGDLQQIAEGMKRSGYNVPHWSDTDEKARLSWRARWTDCAAIRGSGGPSVENPENR